MAINQERIDALTDIGLIYNGDSFVYQDVNIHWVEVLTMNDKDFNDLVKELRPIVADRKAKNDSELEQSETTAIEAAGSLLKNTRKTGAGMSFYNDSIMEQMQNSEPFKTCIIDSMLFHRKANAHLLKKKKPKFYQTLNKKRHT